ncbi:MAG: PEGA domain-containing protein, partial [Gammaproteobacteria bacterium]|nr:PEGA domain-containing protein [Gammaproteobacteria bacterium]
MSGFDKDSLIKAQRARRRRMMLGIGGVILILLVSAGVYLGTAVIDRVFIAVAPDEALDIAQLEILDGTGWVWNDEIIAVRSPLKLQVSADGFKKEVLTIGDATWRRGQLDVVLKPLPATVMATTKPESDDVRWYLNGALASVAPKLTIDLPAGQHTIEARHPHFEPASQLVTLERGESYQLSLDLKPVKGIVEITSAPSGAEVALNSESIGKTPLHLELDGGEYEIALSLTNHDPRKDSFVISADKPEVSRHYKLAVSNRVVTFSLAPADGSLTVGGNTVASRETVSVSLPVNSRQTATYSKSGFRTQEIEFEVNSKIGNQIEIELQPVYGMVEVRSNPKADVSHNGKTIGTTPVLVRMQTLPQTFTVSQKNFLPETRTITPVEDTTRVLEVNLVSEQEHRLKTSPDTYVNSIGIKIKLIKEAHYFTMGSKPRE